jgi:type IV secretion system protein VirB5
MKAAAAQPENPYVVARREWDERYGDLVVGRRNWQILAGVLALSNLALVGLMAWFGLHSKVIPYVVEVDKLGYALAVRAPNAAPGGAEAADRMVRYELASFIRNARSVSSDRGSEQQMLQTVLSHSHAAASGFLNAYYHAENPPHNPFKISEHQTVSVQIDSILSLSKNSWQVRWTEEQRQLDGTLSETNHWEAVLETEIVPPTSEESIVDNPLGFYVSRLSWSKVRS